MKKIFLFFIIFNFLIAGAMAGTTASHGVTLTVINATPPAPVPAGSGSYNVKSDYFSIDKNKIEYTGLIVPNDFITTQSFVVKSLHKSYQTINLKLSCDSYANCAAQFCTPSKNNFILVENSDQSVKLECKIPSNAVAQTEYRVNVIVGTNLDQAQQKTIEYKFKISSQEEIESELQRRREQEQINTTITYTVALGGAAVGLNWFLGRKGL